MDSANTNLSQDQPVADFCLATGKIKVATKNYDGTDREMPYINQSLHHEIVEAIKSVFEIKIEHDDVERMAQGYAQVLGKLGIYLIEDVESGKTGKTQEK